MSDSKRKILVLVEGARTDARLMKHLLVIYNIDVKYEIVSYGTNIYTLYGEMFDENDPSTIDLLQLLKEREPDPVKKLIFDDAYSDILLIFDFEPHANDFSPDKIRRMAEYFVESSDMGKLYLNYPMVEAFYHMLTIPDEQYNNRFVTLEELRAGSYKMRVHRENRNHDYTKFAINRSECNIVIQQNIDKARNLTQEESISDIPNQVQILTAQLTYLMQAFFHT